VPKGKTPNPLPVPRRLGWLLFGLLCWLTAPAAWAGTGVQRIQNGNFSRYPITSGSAYTIAPGIDLGAWRSGATYVNTGTRPGLGQVSIQRAAVNYTAPNTITTQQSTFPGDAGNGVPASNTYLLYRGSAATAVWYQTSSVRPNTTYNFTFYASNANIPGTTTTPVPVLQFQLNGVAQGSNITLANETVAGGDVWTRYNFSFTTGATQTAVELRLVDLTAFGANANNNTSDQLALTGLSLRTPSADAGPSYSCDGSFYQARQVDTAPANGTVGNSTRLFEVIRSTTPYTTTELQDLGGTFNAVGYNSIDGYLYALTYTGNVNPTGTNPQSDRATDPSSVVELVKIGTTGLETLGSVTGLPVDQWAAGTFDRSGNLYVKNQTNSSVIYRINLSSTPLTATAINTVNSGGNAVSFTIFDLAYNPIDNLLYGTSYPGILYVINPTTGVVTQVGNTVSDNTQPLGTAFFDISGNLYAYGNGPTPVTATSGNFYLINKSTGAASQINTINGATNSDGASCINPLQRIDVVKTVTNVVPVSATQYDVTYVVQVKNTGTVTDLNVQVSDLLRGNANNTTFPTSTALTLQSISVQNFNGATLAANNSFTGVSGGASLLSGTQSLSPNQRATITFTVRVTFPAGAVPTAVQNNTAYATSTTTAPNNGYTQLADGTLLTPFDLVANDASTNGSVLPPNRTGLNDTGDSPSPTPLTFAPAIFGNVFEDVNYGGGAGRDLTASQGVSRSGVRVELYTGSGATATFAAFTTTDANGNYSFANLTNGATYTVRVPNNATNAVTSSRTNLTGATGLLPVQTFVYNDVNRVGGENPQRVDAGNGASGTTIGSLSVAASGTTPGTIAQSIATVTLSSVSASPVVNVNFGFNFDVVTNTNNSGQGSLRQFITNSNALGGESALAQEGSNAAGTLPAGQETSIFMISGGTAVPGLRAGLPNQLTAGVAVITPATATFGALPAISGANTRLDGTTQTFNLNNPNNVTLGTGGTVGTNATALSQLNGPEVQIVGTPGAANSEVGLDLRANNVTVTGLSIYGFGNTQNNTSGANIRVTSTTGGVATTGTLITGNVIGTAATTFPLNGVDPNTAATRSTGNGIYLTNGTAAATAVFGATISNNLIGYNGTGGIEAIVTGTSNGSTTGLIVTGNEIRGNAILNNASDGIRVGVNGGYVANNLFQGNQGPGVDFAGSAGNTTVTNNTISNNGLNGAGQTSGIRMLGANNTVSQNIISNNYGAGVLAQPGTSTSLISQNAIFGNGTVLTSAGGAASGQIGIDLLGATDNVDRGTAPYVTLNDSGDGDTGANGLLNFPVITSATVQGSNLIVQGFARPGSIIEFFNPGATADASGFGEGQTYLGTFTEGSAADQNPGTGSYSGLVNGINQGSDNTNAFAFIIPLTGNFAGYAAGSLLTSTATLAGATSEFSGNVTVNAAPVPNSVTNVAIPNTNGATVLNPNLSATAGTGTSISYYTIASLPASGTLTYNGTVLTAANIGSIQILPAQLGTLTYTPVSGFTGGSVSFTYTATDANNVPSTTNNTGGTISNGPATYTIPVTQVADVATSITPSANPVNAGAALSFAVTYTNAGPNTAAGYTQTLQLTAGLGAANVTFTGLPTGVTASYNNTTGVVTFTGVATTLASGANQNFTVNIAAVPATLTQVVASTTVGTSTGQGADTGANSASSTVNVTPVADVATTLTGPSQVIPGSTNSYTVTYANNGPSTAAGVTRTVTLPAGATNVTVTGGTLSGNVITFPTLSTLNSGASNSFTFSFTPPAAGGALTSTVGTSTGQNGATANDNASITLNVAGPGFSCNSAFYRVRDVSGTSILEVLTRTSSGNTVTYNGTTLYDTGVSLNALAFNYADGYLYAFQTGTRTLYRLSSTGAQNLGNIAGVVSGANAATSDLNGNMYIASNSTSTLYRLNLSTLTLTTLTLSQAVNFGDMAYNPVDNNIYANRFYNTANGATNGVARLTLPTSGTTVTVTVLGTPATTGDDVGSMFFDAAGVLYTATNQGNFGVYNLTTGAITRVGSAGTAGQSDGASCVFPTEDIDVALSVGTPVRVSPTAFDVTYTVRVKNTGAVTDPNVQLSTFLNDGSSPAGAAFPGASSVTVTAPPTVTAGTALAVNPGFNGTTSPGLLAGTSSLPANATTTLTYTVRVTYPSVAAIPTTAQTTSAYASVVGASPNAGYVLVNGVALPPYQVLAADQSTNGSTLPATAGGDTPSPTPVVLANPLAQDITNVTVLSTASAAALNPSLSATPGLNGTGAAITTFTVTGPVSSGTLYYNGVPVTGTITVPVANVGQLSYQPTVGLSGNATFTFTATDANGLVSNPATYTIPVAPVADVTTTLTGPTTLTAGSATGTYTATFSNNGPSAAANVAQTVQLPAGSTLTTAQLSAITSQGGSYNSGTNVINFGTAATLANGATNTFTFSFTAPNQSGASVAIVSNVSTSTNQGADTAPNSATVNATIAPVADVTTTLSGPSQLSAGQPATFSVTFANEGPTTASNVSQVVTLPSGATLTAAQVAALPAGAAYNSGTNTIDFGTAASLASGASNTYSFAFTAPTATGAATLSSTTSTSSSEGPNLAPNTATLALTVNATADVAVTLTPSAATVVSGQPASYTVTFSNNGAQAAAGVVASVQLPAGLSGVTVTNGGTYNSSTGLVTYPSGSLPAGTSVSSVISFTAPASGSVTATASISTTTGEAGQTANNTASSTISITPGFDLSTTLSGPTSAQPGNLVTLNVTTTNNSGQAALNAVQTVQLVAGLSDVFVSNGGSYNSSTGLVTFPALASLAAGQTVANTISFAAPTTAFAPVATVTPNTTAAGDSNPANNTAYLNGAATATNLTIQAASANTANLGTTITASAQTVNANATVTLTVVASNAGPNAATGVTETVQLLPSLSGVVVSNGGTYNSTTGIVTFPTLATLASGASQTYTISFTAPANVGNNGQLLATASVHSNTADPVTGDNVDATVVTVRPTADLTAAISGPATAVAGQTVTYSTTFGNSGPAAATNVATTTQLPAGLSGVVVLDNTGAVVSGAYNAATGLVTFPVLASAGAGTTQSFTISFVAPATGSLSVVSSVSSATADANTANNTASTTTTLAPSADLSVALSGPATAVIGNALTYAVTTTNNGPSAAASVAPTLQLPTGLTILSLPAGASYNSGTGLATFATIASLPGGASQTSAVTFVMPSPASGQITATASASTTTADPNLSNNTQALQTSVAPATSSQANLATTLTPSATSVAPGAPLTLTATFSNAGPAAALNVAPVAYLPAGLSGVVVSNGGTYNSTTGVVTWPVIASQASGSTATYTVQLTAPANGPLLASAATSSATSDPSGADNVASTSVTITPSYDEVTTLSGPATAQPGASLTYTVQTINNGPSNTPSATQTVTLPAGVTASNISGGGTQSGTTITFPAVTNQAPGSVVVNTFTVTMPASGSLSLTASVTAAGEASTGNNTASFVTSPFNAAPVASNVVNNNLSPIGNTAVATTISALSATDANGSVVSYQLTSIPATSQGVLYYNNGGTYTAITAANFAGLSLTPAQVASLQFDPVATFVGNATFTYTATDNQGAVSNVALYTIPVGNDTPAVYTLLPPTGGQGNPYPNGSTLASVVDVNGATYNAAGTLTYNGIVSAVLTAGTLPAGTALNATTGEITVTQANQLNPGSYPLTITTTDAFGGVTVHTITLVIGASPIAVDDYASTLPGVAVTFSATANDLPNGGPNIQASTLDLNPAVAGIQGTVTTAQGTWTTAGSAAGSVTFTPAAGFTGVATLPYIVQNTAGSYTNQANLIVTVAPAAPVNLSTTISASANPVNAGAPETLTVVATNNSATTTATGVVETVSIPAGLTVATLTIGGQTGTLSGSTITFANGASYNTSTGLLTFPAITLAPSASQTFTLTFNAPAAGPFTATAQVSNGTVDPVPANNTASVVISVTPQFDLSTAIAGPAAVVNGNLATFTVLTTNAGPSTAPAAVQTVQLPTGLTGVFATNGGTYNSSNGVVTFPAVVLSSGQTVNNTVSFATLANGFTASATVTPNTTGTGDVNPANNSVSAPATAILPTTGTPATSTLPLSGTVANTSVTISGPTSALPGQTGLTYTITQTNDGPTAASNVQTQVSLLAGLSGVTVSNGGTYNSTTGIVTFPAIASQLSSASQTYTISLTAPATGAAVVLSASTTSTTTDPMAGNNVATIVTNLTPNTDVVASISGPTTVVAGQTVAYTVTLRNTSTTPAATVVGTVQLVAGLTAATLTVGGQTGTLSGGIITFASGATYNPATGVLTLAPVATLAPGAVQSLGITFAAPALASLSASASVSTATPESNLSNNASATTATVTPAADVTVQVSGPATATAGNLVTYAVTTSNNGPSAAASVTTTVQLPTGLSGVIVRDNTGTIVAGAYNATTGVVTFPTATNLPTGTANQLSGTISFEAPNSVRVDVTAVAAVSNGTGDFALTNNTATVVTTLSAAQGTVVDLQTTLTANVSTQTTGQPVTFTLTTANIGSAPASGVAQQVLLPAGLSATGLQVNGVTGTVSGSTIVFANAVYNTTSGVLTFDNVTTLTDGTSVTNTVTLPAPGYSPLVATATASASNPDNSSANNTATATVGITTSADVATTISGPATTVAGATVSYTAVTVNNGPANATGVTTTMTLPVGATNVVLPANATLAGNVVTFASTGTLLPGAANAVTSTVTFTAPAPAYTVSSTSTTSSTDPNAGNNTSSISTTAANQAPAALSVVNTLQSPEGNTAVALPIAALQATDPDGSIASYTITALPPASQGVLYVNGVALTAANFPGLVLTPAQAAQLQFDPTAGYVGSVTFAYTATDNGNGNAANALTSAPALYALAVGQDNASVYTNTPQLGGSTPYTNGYALSNAFDINGGSYSSASAVTDNGVRNAILTSGSNPLPAGVSLNPATGQIYVSNASALVSGTYTVTITTTDVYGGITTQNVTFTIGPNPLPVELTVFTAQAVNTVDAKLAWTTASERNSLRFEVERSLNGRDFVAIGQRAAQGTSSAPTAYTLTDAGIGRRVSGAVYYRLKQVDLDGTFSYSPVRTVAFTKATPAIGLFPNPATSATQLDLRQLPAGSYQVRVLDATGRVILGLQLEAGLAHGLDLSQVASGTYTVVVRGQELTLTKRLIKD